MQSQLRSRDTFTYGLIVNKGNKYRRQIGAALRKEWTLHRFNMMASLLCITDFAGCAFRVVSHETEIYGVQGRGRQVGLHAYVAWRIKLEHPWPSIF
jgi:hypothetical protein